MSDKSRVILKKKHFYQITLRFGLKKKKIKIKKTFFFHQTTGSRSFYIEN